MVSPTTMASSRLRNPLPWLHAAMLLALASLSLAQTNPCQQSPCVNGGVCRQAYLLPGYICECSGGWLGQDCQDPMPSNDCGTNFYADSGTVESPNFPQPTPHNDNCFYLIRIPSALSITLFFDVFVSEAHKDELFVYPATSLDLTSSYREYNGTLPATFPPQVFNTNQLVLHWLTDFNIGSPGFSIRYEIDPDPCWVNPCQNGGTCTTTGRNYSCACLSDFSGINCEMGTVIISQTTISISAGASVAEGRADHNLIFDLSFSPAATQFSLTGTGLWSVTLFLMDNANNRVATQVVPLTPQQSNVPWLPPAASVMHNVQTTVSLNTLSCPQMRFVCATIGQGLSPSVPFFFRGTPNDQALTGCAPVQCRGVEVTSVSFDATLRDLREGVNSQSLQFALTMATDPNAGRVSGTNLWQIALFGNTQDDGLGTSVLVTQLALSQAQAGAGVDGNGNVFFYGLSALLNLDGLTCPQLRYLCVRVEQSANPLPQFTLTGVPSEAALTACQATTCRGIKVTDTSVSITSGNPIIERRSNSLVFSLSISTDGNGGNVQGQNLWTVRTFGSNSLTGTSLRISERQVQGSVGITAGFPASMPGLTTTMDLSGRLCHQIVAFCTELGKSLLASPDFTLEPTPDNSVLQQCVDMECRGVYIQSLGITLTRGGQLLFGNRNQEVALNLRVQADGQSASIAGSGLWRLVVYANNQLDGQGARQGQVSATLTAGQESTAISAGQTVNFYNVQVGLDLSAVTSCADILYLCVQLQKSTASSPDFTLQGSTTRCTEVQCAMHNPCGSNPCQNAGVCTNTGGSFTCACGSGWTGPFCTVAVDACVGVTCLNGGTCNNLQFSFQCRCRLGWMGTFCAQVDNGVVITTTGLSVNTGSVLENAQNTLSLSVTLTSSVTGTSLASGSGYWQVHFFTSQQPDGLGSRFNQQTLNLNAFQAGLGVVAGSPLTLAGLPATLNLLGQACSRAPYVCVEVQKGSNPSPDFLLSGSLIACQPTNCKGVQVIQVRGTVNSGRTLLIGQSSHTVNLDITVRSSSAGASISGSNLWRAVIFINNLLSGTGTTSAQQNAFLDTQAVNTALLAGSTVALRQATVTFNLAGLTSCQQVLYLCVQLGKNPLASPDFTLTGLPDDATLTHCQLALCQAPSPCESHNCQNGGTCRESGTSYFCDCVSGWRGDYCTGPVNACLGIFCANGGTCINNQFNYLCQCTLEWQGTNCRQQNQGVIITTAQTFFPNVVLREGATNNNFNFNVVLTSDVGGQSVAGTGLWQFDVYGCGQADGGGARYALSPASYNPAQGGQLSAGARATLSGLQASLDLSQVVCAQVPFVCVEVMPGVAAQPPFVLSGDRVACAPVPCVGVDIINPQLSVTSSTDVKERNDINPVTLDLTITASPSGGSVTGSRLWRMTAFLSSQLDGSGVEYAPTAVQLSDAQAGVGLSAGFAATIVGLRVDLNTALDGLRCGQFGYVCTRLERGLNPTVDFRLGDGTQSYVACAPLTCRGVEITDVVATILSGQPVNSETSGNSLLLNVQVSSSPNGASVSGEDLWRVIVFTDTQPNGQGQTVVQAEATLPGNTASAFIHAGVDMILRSAAVSLDLTQISCSQVPYVCVRFLQAANPRPDFTFSGVPTDAVLLHCQPLSCMDPSACEVHSCVNGVCTHLGPGSYRCDCTAGWTGIFCDIVEDYCLITQSPCLNGGQCVSLSDRYQCNCPPSWVGTRCQTDNPCLPNNPCFNGGTCFPEQTGGFNCFCLNGFSGDSCQIAPDPCQSHLCQNSGRCERVGTGSNYECVCPLGYAGTYCNVLLDPCGSSPCLNGGTCSQPALTYTYQCLCPDEYTGTYCQTRRDPCGVNPCQNGGVCSRLGPMAYQCQCSLGFAGINCDTRLDPCHSNPCVNGGFCSRVGASYVYQCQCLQGFSGTNCEIPNACASTPCQNGGICTQIGGQFQCQCSTGYTGLTCSTVLNPCDSNPCVNGGFCSWVGTSYVYQCQCQQGFSGTNCEMPNACASSPCQNGGICAQIGAQFQCQCSTGYTGLTCGTILNPCDSNPCVNGGFCSRVGASYVYQCQCLQGFSGTNCEMPNACASSPCQNGGICTQLGAQFQCQCSTGYTGLTCGTVLNPCDSNPCVNGGFCSRVGASYVYQCQCLQGFSGTNCEMPNACASSPCQNGGICTQLGTQFQCQCSTGYTGLTCGTVLNPCDSNPCVNGGLCSRVGASYVYQCQCLQGFSGTNCEMPNACASTPCQNGGICTQIGAHFQCQCSTGYTGPTCRIVLNPCDSNPCVNGGFCSRVGTSYVYQCQCLQGFSGTNCEVSSACVSAPCQNGGVCSQIGSGFQCQCQAGYTGVTCGTVINPCVSTPCLNGATCLQLGTDFSCQCAPGYTGTNCGSVQNPCVSTPCLNGATCIFLGTDFLCQCAPGYTGANCGSVQNPCVSTPCLNGATCLQQGTDFSCQCAPGYTGTNCGSVQNPCVSTPCLNGATCLQLGTDFSCQCAPGYTGTNCGSVPNPCNSNPCLNNGFCQWINPSSATYTCQCSLGFTGLNCQNAQNPCASNPCVNGGQCSWLAPGYRYRCQCPAMFTGINCGTSLGLCFSAPCLNGGTCFPLSQGTGYFCSCPTDVKGANCQYPEPCTSSPCVNGGVCFSDTLGSTYSCVCPANFLGNSCQYPNPCSSQPCQNNGLCVPDSVGASYVCNCGLNFLGTHCQFLNPCVSGPCFNGGQCETDSFGSRYTCSCIQGYIGSQCQFDDQCIPNPCQNGAICSPGNGGQTYVCSCLNGFFGNNCQIPDPCNFQPCLNGGTCSAVNGGLNYICSCLPQFMGNTCENPNPCFSLPCQNGGTCEPHPQGISFTCICLTDFQGTLCQNRNPCASNPCLNGGFCQVGIGGTSFFCSCPAQYLGVRCENLDPCLSTPCQNGGTCSSTAQGLLYSCTCPPSYFGLTCEIQDPCIGSPCLNGGICNPLTSGYTCICMPGFNGLTCSIPDPCGRQPCLNGGTCFESTGPLGFFCRCAPGFIGDTCQNADLCSFRPCLNGAQCSNMPSGSGFVCTCSLGYSGERCEQYNPCSSNPCLNSGTCTRNDAGTSYICLCQPGYMDPRCESGPNCFSPSDFRCLSGECIASSRQCDRSFDCQDGSDEAICQFQCTVQEFRCTGGTCINVQLVCNGINECQDGFDEENCPTPCDSSPCRNGATCANAGINFVCICVTGWTGTTCERVVESSNDPPSFLHSVITINIRESTLPGTSIFSLEATDPEGDVLTFGLFDFVAQELFLIVPTGPMSANLSLKKQLDRENQYIYRFVVSVSDGRNEVIHDGTLLLEDVNDNAPTFTNLPNTTTVYENESNFNLALFHVHATDPDVGLGSFVTYTITQGVDAPFFINTYSGVITLTGSLDYETTNIYTLGITATDQETPPLTATAPLTIQVLDVQDTGPIFVNTPYNRTINEGTPLNTLIVTLMAMDQDTVASNDIIYSIISGNQDAFFILDAITGAITLAKGVDRENPSTPAAVELTVQALEIGATGGSFAFNTFTIYLNDVDDEPPTFNQSTYSVSISEAENPGFVLPVGIEVGDGEAVIQGNFRITLQDSNVVPFSVSPSSAVDQATATLTLIRPLDFEAVQSYDLQLTAEDTAATTALVVVTVTDANDNDPIFTHGTQTIALEEGSPMGTPVATVTVTDADQGINAETEFSIVGGNQDGLFAIDATTGVVTTTTSIDYENSARTYTLTVEARNTQPAVPPADGVSEVTVVVTITDINDSPPIFQQPNYYIQIIEQPDAGLTIGRVIADDADSGAAGQVTYTIMSGNEEGTFSVDPTTGNIVLLRPLDRETTAMYNITIWARDNAAPSLTATTYVVIEVRDFNDNDPQWMPSVYTASVVEGQPADTFLVQVRAVDADLGQNAELRYELALPSDYLYVNEVSGRIYTSVVLDREEMESLAVNILVGDNGNPRRYSSLLAQVTVTVLDINDTPPMFTGSPFSFEVAENQPSGTFVGQVTAEDLDIIGTLSYSFVTPQAHFQIDPTTGEITTINSLDREQRDLYATEVRVTDGTFTATAPVTFRVTDANDNAPAFTQAMYAVTVTENTPAGLILTLAANDTDIDLNSAIVYQFDATGSAPMGPFFLDRSTGELRTTSPLDRERQDSYLLVVIAMDRLGGAGALQTVATVLVTVTDANDNRPVFDQTNYVQSVAEDAAEGDEIIQVEATDRDIGANAVILYRIVQGDAGGNFRIEPDTGVVTRGPAPLDRETKDSYALIVEAYNEGEQPPHNTATVTVVVTDVNDEAPRFTQGVYLKPDLLETADSGALVVTVSADDPDLGQGGQIQYSITGGNEGNYFLIDSFSGVITVLGALPDYSFQSSYNLTVTARDQAAPFHTSHTTVRVFLVDAQDDPPVFTQGRYEVNLTENVGEGFPFLQVVAQVPGKPSSIVTYSLEPNVSPTVLQLFEVEPFSGWLVTRGAIDYETRQPLYTFTILGINGGTLSGSAAVWVYIQDVNDNPPVFVSFPSGELTVEENMDQGYLLATVAATDADSGLNGDIVYTITGGNQLGHFNIFTSNGEGLIVTTTQLDREAVANYTLTITASDQGVPILNSSIFISIAVGDLNDNPPMFAQLDYNGTVEENVQVNQAIVTVVVTDLDVASSNNLEFQIDPTSNPGGVFQINSLGEITTNAPLDREEQAFYDLVVIMMDTSYSAMFMETTHVLITVLDQNDNPPVFPPQPEVSVTEGSSSTGQVFVTVTADDADAGDNAAIVYTITGGNGEGIFGIHSDNGSIYVIKELDRETTSTYELLVTATDQAGDENTRRSATVTITINVEDINDTPPMFSSDYFGPHSFSEGVSGTYIGTFLAQDADSGMGGQITYTITGEYRDLFVINPTTGILTLKPTAQLDYETSQAFNITIVATDGGVPSLNGTTTVGIIVVNINDNSPRFQDTPYRAGINDTTPVGTWVYTVVASDADIGPDGDVTYSIFDGNTGGVFRIDPSTGDVYVNRTLTNGVYVLIVKARDNPENPANAREVTETLTILVADSTNVLPVFPNNGTFTASVLEHSISGTFVMTISIENEVEVGDTLFTISGAEAALFTIQPTTGVISVNGLLDAEIKDLHVFNVSAIDSRGVLIGGVVYVTVLNINDHPPQFDEDVFNFTVPEDAVDGYYVGQVNASDADNAATTVRFTIERGGGDKFAIEPTTGVITVAVTCRGDVCEDAPLDRESQDLYTLTIAVTDQGSPPLSTSGVVYIYVTDVNDVRPYFPDVFLDVLVSVSEDAALNHTVTTVQAVDLDLTAMLTYSVVSLTATTLDGSPFPDPSVIQGWFTVDPDTGTVKVSTALDRETVAEVILIIGVADSMSVDQDRSTSDPNAKVTIQITDVNDNAPVFQPTGTMSYDVTIQEESGVGTIIVSVMAVDPDNPINGVVTYTLTGNLSGLAVINPLTGQITVNQVIDRELYDWLNLTIVATDSGLPSLSTSVPISIRILDVNDHNPIFDRSDYASTVIENFPAGTLVVVATATDQDIDQYGEVTYTLTGGDGWFTINSTTGVITTLQPLDREAQSVYTLTVIATDNPSGSVTNRRQGSATVTVTVGDANEFPPTTQPLFPFVIPEGLPGDTLVGVIDATDPDDPMQTLNYTIVVVSPPDGDVLFYINQTTGQIFTTVPLDADNATYGTSFNITILISDNGEPPLTTTTTTVITIQDTNDNDPTFPDGPYDLTTSEATPVGFEVTVVTAVDADQNSVLTYSIIGGNENGTFFINPTYGEILITKPLDFETKTLYNLTVLVEDQDGRAGTTYVVIRIMDANDQGPVFLKEPYLFEIDENVAIGTEVGRIEAVDADPDPSNSQLTYHITVTTPADAPFTINATSGVIESNGALDRETLGSYALTVEVINTRVVPGGEDVTYKLSTPVTVTVLDLNDNTPTLAGGDNITKSFLENSEVDFPIYQPSAEDLDIGENGRITFSIVSGNVENTFRIDAQTGAVVLARLIHTLTTPIYSFTLVVEARDNGNPSLYSNITLNLLVGDFNDNAPRFVTPTQGQVLYLPENEPIGLQIAAVLATDADNGLNGQVVYGFLNEESIMLFYYRREGDMTFLYSNFTADREMRDRYNLVLLATDRGTPKPLQTPLDVTVVVLDKNDNEPYFLRVEDNVAIVQLLNVTEHSRVNTTIGFVTPALDRDVAPNNIVYYYIVGGNEKGLFAIDMMTGQIIVQGDLDRETLATHRLIIKATNNASYIPSGVYDATKDISLKEVEIQLMDINDNGPLFTSLLYSAGIPRDAEINTEVTCVRAEDLDLGGGGAITYAIQSSTFVLGQDRAAEADIFYIEEVSGCIRTRNLLSGIEVGGYFDLTVTATDQSAGLSDTALVRIFVLDTNQQVVVVINADIDTVKHQLVTLIELLSNITGGTVNVDSISYYIDANGNTVKDKTMIVLHVIDPATNTLINANVILRLIDENGQSIKVLFQLYEVVDVYPLMSGFGGAGFNIIEIALIAFALLLILGALIFIIILCCLQRKYLKKVHGNSAAVIYATRSDADVKGTTTYQGSNPLWLETEGGLPDDWPDSISLLGGGAREYEAQEASMDFFSDIPAEVAHDALVMTAIVNDSSVRKNVANGGVTSNGRIGTGAEEGHHHRGGSGATTRMVDSANSDGSVSTLTNRLHRDGSVSANLSGKDAGGYSASGPSYSYSSAGFISGGAGTSTGLGQKLTAEKAYEMRQLLEEDSAVDASYLDDEMYGNGEGMSAARAIYREQVEFDNQLSPITEEDTTSSWSSWTRDSERSGTRYPGAPGSLDRNRVAVRPGKDYPDPMNSFTTSSTVEESYSHSVKGPHKTESSSYSRRANSKTYSAGVATSIGMVTLTEETPEMMDEDESDTSSSREAAGKTYTYNVMGDSSEGGHSLSGTSSGYSAPKRLAPRITMDSGNEVDETVEEEQATRRSVKTTQSFSNQGYDNYLDEESRL